MGGAWSWIRSWIRSWMRELRVVFVRDDIRRMRWDVGGGWPRKRVIHCKFHISFISEVGRRAPMIFGPWKWWKAGVMIHVYMFCVVRLSEKNLIFFTVLECYLYS